MISFDDTLDIVLKNAPLLAEQKIHLKEAAGCVLAENIVSDVGALARIPAGTNKLAGHIAVYRLF